jgi:hypothetical protein
MCWQPGSRVRALRVGLQKRKQSEGRAGRLRITLHLATRSRRHSSARCPRNRARSGCVAGTFRRQLRELTPSRVNIIISRMAIGPEMMFCVNHIIGDIDEPPGSYRDGLLCHGSERY